MVIDSLPWPGKKSLLAVERSLIDLAANRDSSYSLRDHARILFEVLHSPMAYLDVITAVGDYLHETRPSLLTRECIGCRDPVLGDYPLCNSFLEVLREAGFYQLNK